MKARKTKEGPRPDQNLEIPEIPAAGGGAAPLVPKEVLVPLWLLALALPNAIYSGTSFADPLRIMKWAVIGGSVALAVFAAGYRLLLYGGKRFRICLDPFGVLLTLMLVYCAAQPLWVDISSATGLVQELACLASVWAFYVLSAGSFPEGWLRPLLWLAGVNGAFNTLCAELQVRGMNTLLFLRGTAFDFLFPLRYFIWPIADQRYVGNTGQRNLLALWLGICFLGLAWLFVTRAMERKWRSLAAALLNLALLAVNAVGIWGAVSRAGTLALFSGLLVMSLMMAPRAYLKRLGLVLLLFAAVAGGLTAFNSRGSGMLHRMADTRAIRTLGKRLDMWRTSLVMLKEHPMGVGVGQYKWHYLEAQREKFKTNTEDDFRYSHWAHNEFLHWFCEGGVIGGALLVLMYALWLAAVLRALRSGRAVSPAAAWACSLVALVSVDALATRPFHRFEDIIWLALAFALSNREFFRRVELPKWISRPAGAACLCASLAGLVYLGSGIQGNVLLKQGLDAQNPDVKEFLLEAAAHHPLVREEATRNLGLHYLDLGSRNNDDIETLRKGLQLLWESFSRQPIASDMIPLLQWAQRFQVEPLIQELVSYLKPDMYQLGRKLTTNSKGEEVSALYVYIVATSDDLQPDGN